MRYDETYRILAERAIKQTRIDLDTFAELLVGSGLSNEQIREQLINDLENNGPIFGKFFRSLGGAAESAVNTATRQGQAVGTAMDFDEEYDDFVSVNDLEDVIDDADPEAMEAIEDRIADLEHTWIAELVNTCELCLPLHGTSKTLEEWNALGLNPATIHLREGWVSKCHCQLIPKVLIDDAGGRDAFMAPLSRVRVKTETGLPVSKKTVRAVGQRDLDRAIEAVKKASESLTGRRTLRMAGKVNAE
jgi:hypothetical protein